VQRVPHTDCRTAVTLKAREENTVVAGGCYSNKAAADRRFLVDWYVKAVGKIRRLTRPSCFRPICHGCQASLNDITLSDRQPL